MALFELPPLPLELVFSGLKAEDRRRLPLVCRASHQACLLHPALSQRLTVRPAALAALPAGCGSWRAHLAARGCHTTELTLQGSADALSDAQQAELLALFPHTRSLTLDGCLARGMLRALPDALPALRRLEMRGYSSKSNGDHFFTFDGSNPICEVPPQGYKFTWDSLHLPAAWDEHSMHMQFCQLSRLDSLALLAPGLDLDVVGEHLAPLTGLTELRLGGLQGQQWGEEDEDWHWDALAPLTNLRRLTLEAQVVEDNENSEARLRCCAVVGDADGPAAAFALAFLSQLTFLSFVGSNRASALLGQPRAWDVAGSEGDKQLSAELVVEGVSQLPALHELRMEGRMEGIPDDLWHATGLTRLLLRSTYSPTGNGMEDEEDEEAAHYAVLPVLPSTGLQMRDLRELCLCGTTVPAGLMTALAGLTQLTALALCNVVWTWDGVVAGHLSALSSLTGLQELDLSGNAASPAEVEALAPLTALRVLRLDKCDLGWLPSHGPYASLEVLTLAKTSLCVCPAESLMAACPRLLTLDLSDNEDLPFSRGLLGLARRGGSQGTRLRALYICPDTAYCWDKSDNTLLRWLKWNEDPEESAVLDGLLELWHAGQLRLGLGCSYASCDASCDAACDAASDNSCDAAWPWRRRHL